MSARENDGAAMTDAELTLWMAAERAMDEYRYQFMEHRGGTRADSVGAAFAADDAVERVHDIAARFDDLSQKLDHWLSLLNRCPDVQKRWHGLREYREDHRVKGRA